jgi:hypothetical protein
MARGEDTSKHPNRMVSLDNFAQVARMGRALATGQGDNAPAGGIQRPEMESCAGCGENTPKGSGSCADCK